MFILSNKKFLATLAMVACLASVANAQDVRRKLRGSTNGLEEVVEVENRVLKAKKKNKKKGPRPNGVAATTNFGFVSNANNFGATVQKPVGHIQMFEDKCPSVTKIYALEGCVSNNFGNIQACKQCLISKQTLNLADANTRIKSCFQEQIPGFCTAACDVEAYQYFGCGTGQPDLGVPVTTPAVVTTPIVTTPVTTPAVTTPVVTTPVVTTPVVTTPAVTTPVVTVPDTTTTTTTDSGMTTSITATATASTPGEAPSNFCPTSMPGSGTDCALQGYESMTCWYPGYMKCVCGSLSPIFLCTDES